MLVRVTRRIVEAVVLLLAVGTIVFFLEHAVPGDPAVAILGGAAAHPTKEAVAAVTAQYGFDRPLLAQYGDSSPAWSASTSASRTRSSSPSRVSSPARSARPSPSR